MRFIAGLVVIVVALLCESCGGSTCSATSCQGCCLAGVCHGGDETPLCGFGGAFCTNCAASNQVCAQNACVFGGVGGGVGVGGGGAGVGGGGAGVGGGGAGVGGGGAGVGGGGAGVGGGGAGVGGGGAGVGGGGAGVGGGGGNVNDPCNGVTANGDCLNASTVEFCSVPTGAGNVTLQTQTCGTGTQCGIVNNRAQCVAIGQCVPGTSQCNGANTLEQCDTNGNWQDSTCPNGCGTGAGSAFCKAAGTTPFSGTLQYEYRVPNSGFTDWDTTLNDAIAGGFLVISVQNGSTILDAQVTDANGQYTIAVPVTPGSMDYIVFAAAGLAADGSLAYVVADPGLGAGNYSTGTAITSATVWKWSMLVSSAVNGGTTTIPESSGSGAARIYDFVRYAYGHAAGQYGGTPGLSVIAWSGAGVNWSCGACFNTVPTTQFQAPFQSQVWFGGDTTDQEWWADAVTAHEFGHWVMASYGMIPGEGGSHCEGNPEFPGIAWSEGWATWHSSDIRNNSVYYDKQQGTMFYVDINARSYSSNLGVGWTRPVASGGLQQLIDENEVSATLWSIRNSGSPPSLYSAIASARMTTRINQSPSLRGYDRHSWPQGVDQFCNPISPVDTGIPAPFLADFLDAMVCSGLSTTAADNATNPTVNYPYPSNAPLCQ